MTDTWCDCDWEYRKKITIDHNQVVGDETDFPVLISVTDGDLADTVNGGHMESANGYDVKFYSTNCSALDFEIEYYDNTTGQLICWVKIPSLSSTLDTDIYIYYGNDDPAVTGVDPSSTDTWDTSFDAVWHFTDTTDSTSNGNDMTNVGAASGSTGVVYQAYYFDGSDYMYITPSPFRYTNDFTIEKWSKRTRTDVSETLWCDSTDYSGADFSGHSTNYRPDNKVRWTSATGAAATNNLDTVSTFTSTTVWYYIVYVKDTVTGKIMYVDGSLNNSNGTTGNIVYDNSSPYPDYWYIGAYNLDDLGIGGYFIGYMDEMRVSSTPRSANWIGTTFNTIDDPGAFGSFGAEEDASSSLDCMTGSAGTPCGSWWLVGESSTVTLNYPLTDTGHNDTIKKDIKHFNFWSGNYTIYDNGIIDQPLTIETIEFYDNSSPSLPNLSNIEDMVDAINTFMDDCEEVEIVGLGDCIEGVFVIRNFKVSTIKTLPYAFRFTFTFEKVRDAD